MLHRFTIRMRLGLVAVVVALAALTVVAVAYATGSNINPNTQVGHSGVQVSWTASWSGTPPFDVYFYYGEGTTHTHLANTYATNHTFTHTFWTCTDAVYDQALQVQDSVPLESGSESQTTIIRGDEC